METLKPKICHYLNCESHIHLSVLRKTNVKSEKRTEFWMLGRVITRYKCANANGKGQRGDECFYWNCFEYT